LKVKVLVHKILAGEWDDQETQKEIELSTRRTVLEGAVFVGDIPM
jgi:hypothetical protein